MKPRGGQRDKGSAPVIVRRAAPESGGGHHGSAWKIAYADFITAMMAFFLLLWLVNATTEQQRTGIADYFAPTNLISRSTSGAGQLFGGRTLASDGRMASDAPMAARTQRFTHLPSDEEPDTAPQPHLFHRTAPVLPDDLQLNGRETSGASAPSIVPTVTPARRTAAEGEDETEAQPQGGDRPDHRQADRTALRRAADDLRAAISGDPQLRDLGRQLLIEDLPEGLRIQLVDSDGQAVFATGQAAPNERGRYLLLRAAAVIARLPNPIEITGYTDAAPFRGGGPDGRTNWDLSADRANATRRLLVEAGVAERRLRGVVGRADTDPLRPSQPFDAANRRVSIMVRADERPRTGEGSRPAGGAS